LDDSNNTLSYRIRQAEEQKIPYILIVGEKEKEAKTINVRQRGKKEQQELKITDFVSKAKKLISERSLSL
jgi:threonyl-tRNA synthetase